MTNQVDETKILTESLQLNDIVYQSTAGSSRNQSYHPISFHLQKIFLVEIIGEKTYERTDH